MKRTVPILSFLFLLFALACSDGGDPVSPGGGNDGGDDGPDTTAVSFADDVLPILTSTCASASCHAPQTRSGGLALGGADAYDDLVGVTSAGYGPAVRVVPGDPSASVLYQKLLGNASFGARMPLGGSPLSDDALDSIREWIEEGANDD